jgi:ABC-type Fe3+-siderophore transport system permease subunit
MLGYLSWTLRLAAAGILLQTLFFKFTASPESVYIFTRVGAEPWGRILSGVAELAASLLLLYTPTAPLGAIVAMGVMAGAVGAHLTVLGIEVQDDRGLLFALAVVVLAACAVILYLHRLDLPVIGPRLRRTAMMETLR